MWTLNISNIDSIDYGSMTVSFKGSLYETKSFVKGEYEALDQYDLANFLGNYTGPDTWVVLDHEAVGPNGQYTLNNL